MLITMLHGTGLGMGNNSVYMWSAAQTIARERRIGAEIVYSDKLARASDGELRAGVRDWPTAPRDASDPLRSTHEFTTWPPGFPAVLAALVAAGLSASSAGLCVQMGALFLLITAGALLGRRIAGPVFGVAVAYILAVHPIVLACARILTSDLLCAALMCAGVLGTAHWIEAPRERNRSLLLAVLAAVLAAHIHYVGTMLYVFEAAVVSAVLVRHAALGSPRRPWLSFVLGTALFPLFLLPVALRNLSLTGHLGGVERLDSNARLVDLAGELANAGLLMLPLLQRALPGKLDFVISSAALLLYAAVVTALVRRRRTEAPPGDTQGWATPAARMLAAFSALFAACMFLIRARVCVDELGERLLLPAFVGAVILGSYEVYRRVPHGPRPAIVGSFCALLAAASLIEGRSTLHLWQGFQSPANLARAASARELLARSPSEPGAPPVRLFSDRSVEMHFGLHRSVNWLPSPASLPSLQRSAGGARLEFLIQHESPYFPCAGYQRAYEDVLARHAGGVERGELFDLYRLSTSPEQIVSEPEVSALQRVHAICGGAEL